MARIYSPRELKNDKGEPTGLYHMTVHSDEEGWCMPAGPCAENCPGHPSPLEAYQHYQQGVLAKAKFDGLDENLQRKCLVCGAWTQKAAYVNGEMLEHWALCDAHLNLESLTPLVMLHPADAK